MKYYVLTEEQRTALLKSLELEKFRENDHFIQHAIDNKDPKALLAAVHRKFHHCVCSALDGSYPCHP